MTVVTDTTPLNYLVLIDEVELLPALFHHVLLPGAAYAELQDTGTPDKVRDWLQQLPDWLEVRTAAAITSPALHQLDRVNAKPSSSRSTSRLCSSMSTKPGKSPNHFI